MFINYQQNQNFPKFKVLFVKYVVIKKKERKK